jgi:hypothetical protein
VGTVSIWIWLKDSTTRLLGKFIIIALILGLALIAVKLVLPIAVFQLVATLLALVVIAIAIAYLYHKLRA